MTSSLAMNEFFRKINQSVAISASSGWILPVRREIQVYFVNLSIRYVFRNQTVNVCKYTVKIKL